MLRNINVEYAEYGIYVCSKCHSIINNNDVVCSECGTTLREEVEFGKLYTKTIKEIEFCGDKLIIIELEKWSNILHKDSYYIEIQNGKIRMVEFYKCGTLTYHIPNIEKVLKEAKLEHLIGGYDDK